MLKEVFSVKEHMWEHRRSVGDCISAYLQKCSDGLYEVTIKHFASPRSQNQNRYYWKLVSILADELGYISKDSCHAMLMEECGYGDHMDFRGKTYFMRKSSTSLSKEEFAALIEKCFEIEAFINEGREPEKHVVLPRVA